MTVMSTFVVTMQGNFTLFERRAMKKIEDEIRYVIKGDRLKELLSFASTAAFETWDEEEWAHAFTLIEGELVEDAEVGWDDEMREKGE